MLALPFVGIVAVLRRRLSRAALVRRAGRFSIAALAAPWLSLGLVVGVACAWSFGRGRGSPLRLEPELGPDPVPPPPWWEDQARTPLQHLAW